MLGGSGLIGSQVVQRLTEAGHDVVSASLSTGVDVIGDKGLKEAVEGSEVVINLTNSPVFDESSIGFFETAMTNIGAAAKAAGVGHHVIVSIVGVDQVPELAYYRAKALQENILRDGPTPYTIVRATQFYEFVGAIMSWTTEGDTVRLPSTPVQPMASADVATAVVKAATGDPVQGIRNIAGPEVHPLDELGRITLAARPDGRHVVTDEEAGMFAVTRRSVLLAPEDAELATTRYEDWLQRQP
ncbi:LysR family transcriptional regulator [Streptomyces chromofuscus]|nr:LysR family transcriptional regulator [Streptomyces chromofuscus]